MLIKAPLSDRGHDLYETAPVATHALLRVETLPHFASGSRPAGPGAIARVLRGVGHRVIATDLVDYHSTDQDHGDRGFLLEHKAPDGVEAIVTNPPFKQAGEFVARALRLCPRVVMLLRLSFLESTRRAPILDGGALARVHIFSKSALDDAPRRLDRAARFQSNTLRVVCLGPQAPRAPDIASTYVDSNTGRAKDAAPRSRIPTFWAGSDPETDRAMSNRFGASRAMATWTTRFRSERNPGWTH